MTLLLPIPRAVAFHAISDAVDRFRRLLVAFLLRKPSGARHRVLTPGQIRWRRWKSELADYVAVGLVDLSTDSVPQPRTPVRDHREASRAPAWGALDPPPRTAQSHDLVRHDDDRWNGGAEPTIDYAMPNGGAHRLAEAEPEPSPEVWAEPWAESWVESWSEPCAEPRVRSWPEPWVEPRTEHVDTFFAGHLEEPRHASPPTGRHALGVTAFAHHAVDWPGVTESPDAWPAFAERVWARSAAEPADAVADPETDAETTVVDPLVPEFEVGDLARWWDEAMARLDALAHEEVRNRLW